MYKNAFWLRDIEQVLVKDPFWYCSLYVIPDMKSLTFKPGTLSDLLLYRKGMFPKRVIQLQFADDFYPDIGIDISDYLRHYVIPEYDTVCRKFMSIWNEYLPSACVVDNSRNRIICTMDAALREKVSDLFTRIPLIMQHLRFLKDQVYSRLYAPNIVIAVPWRYNITIYCPVLQIGCIVNNGSDCKGQIESEITCLNMTSKHLIQRSSNQGPFKEIILGISGVIKDDLSRRVNLQESYLTFVTEYCNSFLSTVPMSTPSEDVVLLLLNNIRSWNQEFLIGSSFTV